MIREAQATQKTVVTVTLKNGTVYKNKDVPSNPMTEYEHFVLFWETPCRLKMIPRELIAELEYCI